jgi:hypothetical protein
MSILTSGRTELACFNNIGGIRYVYLFSYVDYLYSQIVGGSSGELTSFPATYIYKWEIARDSGNFSENIKNDGEGLLYEQSFNFTLTQQNLATTNNIKLLNNIELRYIVEFNDGTFRIGGLYNGARLSTGELSTGGTKGELNGYNISITSSESYSAPYISNLATVGFDVITNLAGAYKVRVEADGGVVENLECITI